MESYNFYEYHDWPNLKSNQKIKFEKFKKESTNIIKNAINFDDLLKTANPLIMYFKILFYFNNIHGIYKFI